MRIGVYVGSFNPPHLGHVKVIEYLLEQHYVDKIEVIATGNYWDKTDLIDVKDRINMLKVYETINVIINSALNNLSYTYQIMNCLKEKYPNDELFLIIGDDNLPKFHLWKNYQEILNNQVIVLRRNDINIEDTVSYKLYSKKFVIVNDFPKIDISSTVIRKYLQVNRDYEASLYLGFYVLAYIVNHNLYGVNSTISENKVNKLVCNIKSTKDDNVGKKLIKVK